MFRFQGKTLGKTLICLGGAMLLVFLPTKAFIFLTGLVFIGVGIAIICSSCS